MSTNQPGAGQPIYEPSSSRLGVTLACASITMMFGALTSAAIVRSGGSDWTRMPMPWLLWFNTAVLLASSYTMEKLDKPKSIVLGLLFLAGQTAVWVQISAQGISQAFFYLFTVGHGLHLVGGLFAMLIVKMESARIYWHFLTGLWLFLMMLIWIWR